MIGESIGRPRRLSPRIFIFVTVFVDMLGYGIVIPLLPLYVERLAAGGTLVGLLGSLYALAQSFGGPLLSGRPNREQQRRSGCRIRCDPNPALSASQVRVLDEVEAQITDEVRNRSVIVINDDGHSVQPHRRIRH